LVKIVDIEEKRINESMSETKMGTVHTVLNQGLLVNILENGQLEGHKKEKLVCKLKKILTIPDDNISQDKLQKVQTLVQKWNGNHNKDMKLVIGPRKMFDKDCNPVPVRSTTNDKITSLEGQKMITGMEVKWVDGWYIHSLRLRYEDTWGEEHKTAKKQNGEEKTDVLDLIDGDKIIGVKTIFDEVRGSLVSLHVNTSSGNTWVKAAGYTQLVKRRDSTDMDKRLAYVSSSQGKGGRYQTVFHYV
jgi:hypothetical protein